MTCCYKYVASWRFSQRFNLRRCGRFQDRWCNHQMGKVQIAKVQPLHWNWFSTAVRSIPWTLLLGTWTILDGFRTDHNNRILMIDGFLSLFMLLIPREWWHHEALRSLPGVLIWWRELRWSKPFRCVALSLSEFKVKGIQDRPMPPNSYLFPREVSGQALS